MGRIEDPDAQGLATFEQRRFGLFSKIIKASLYVIPGQIRDLRLRCPDLPSSGEDAHSVGVAGPGLGDTGANRHITANARGAQASWRWAESPNLPELCEHPTRLFVFGRCPGREHIRERPRWSGSAQSALPLPGSGASLGLQGNGFPPQSEFCHNASRSIPSTVLRSISLLIPEHLAEGQIPDLANLYHDLATPSTGGPGWTDLPVPIRIRKQRDLELEQNGCAPGSGESWCPRCCRHG